MSGTNHPTPEDGRLYVTEGGAITRTVADILSSPSRAKAAATMADLRSSNSVALLSKRMRSLADLASHKEPTISEALIDGVVQIERLTRVAAEVEMMALTLEARDKEIERLTRENAELREGGARLLTARTRIEERSRAALERIRDYPSTAKHVSDIRTWAEMSDIARDALSGEPPYQMTASEEASFSKVFARKRVANETTGKSRSAYISDLTVRRLDAGYVVTWQEDGEPCGSETISEKLAYALVRADGGILGITDDSAVKAAAEPSQPYQRKCIRCGKMGPSATPEGVGVYYCSIECAD